MLATLAQAFVFSDEARLKEGFFSIFPPARPTLRHRFFRGVLGGWGKCLRGVWGS